MQKKTMQAIQVHRYGEPEQLVLESISRPVPHVEEVLIRVYAAGVNPIDWHMRQGTGPVQPAQFPYIPGADLAGIVEELGPGVIGFQMGQAVYGQTTKRDYQGAYAEYALASTEVLAPKPLNLSFDEAASVPGGAMTAWQALFDHGRLQAGQRVLIHGAAGDVGLFAVQLAKWKGASVIGTASAANAEFLRALGVDTCIDYQSTPFERVAHDVDLVIDPIGGEVQERSWQVLKPGGTLVVLGAPPSQEKAQAYGVRAIKMMMQPSRELLLTITEFIEAELIKTAVARTFPLSEAKRAHELSQTRHGQGRIILHVVD